MPTPILTLNNHYRFGYDGDWFRQRQTVTERFTTAFGRCEREPGTWREETIEACRRIEAIANGPIQVLFSGGIDSEVTLQAFRAAGIPVEVAIMRFKDGLNDHDIEYALRYCEAHSIRYTLYDLDIVEFMEGGQMLEYASATMGASPQQAATMWLVDQVYGFPVISQGECFLTRINRQATRDHRTFGGERNEYVLHDHWYLRESERINAWYRFFLLRNRAGAPGFHQFTPEQMLSFLRDPVLLDALDFDKGKYSTSSSKLRIYSAHFDLEPRKKFTGYEQIMPIIRKWRRYLSHRFADQEATFAYDDLINALRPISMPAYAPFPKRTDGIHHISFDEAIPMLKKLWPDKKITKYDNTLGRIALPMPEPKMSNDEDDDSEPASAYPEMKTVYVGWYKDGVMVGTSHAYATGNDEVRVRGTYVEPEFRREGIAEQLVQYALSKFPECHTAYTFPRMGSEQFYQSLGFELISGPYPTYKGLYEADLKLR